MKRFHIRKILIPLDFSETSLLAMENGGYMASLFKADIILLHVNRVNPGAYGPGDRPYPVDLIKYQEVNAKQKLNRLANKIGHQFDVEVETLFETGFVSSTIASVAERYAVDLIIMGTHGVSGFIERFIGSNAYRVVNEAICPVITIQTHTARKGFKDIVLPIDNSQYSLQKVKHAIGLANHYGSRIHILGLTHSDDENKINRIRTKIIEVEESIDKNGLLTGLQIRSSKQIRQGVNYAKITMSYAEEIGADLIMIMTEWEENVTGIFIGPFARQIVNHSKIPVMSLRPEVKPELIKNGVQWMMEHH
jgi:nucleotide-binding universal stress UspA family protein